MNAEKLRKELDTAKRKVAEIEQMLESTVEIHLSGYWVSTVGGGANLSLGGYRAAVVPEGDRFSFYVSRRGAVVSSENGHDYYSARQAKVAAMKALAELLEA